MEETAVEWLVNELTRTKFIYSSDKQELHQLIKILEQAKELEKQQIIYAVENGWDNREDGKVRWIGEQYYNEKYNK